jgi:hypothetical protein
MKLLQELVLYSASEKNTSLDRCALHDFTANTHCSDTLKFGHYRASDLRVTDTFEYYSPALLMVILIGNFEKI